MAKKQIQLELDEQTSTIKRRIQFCGQKHEPDKEANTQPSQAIPDTSMSITEMLYRQKRGLPISSGRQPIYNGEKLLPDWKRLDLIDRQQVIKKANEVVEEKKKLKAAQESKIEEQRRQYYEAKIREQAQNEALQTNEHVQNEAQQSQPAKQGAKRL